MEVARRVVYIGFALSLGLFSAPADEAPAAPQPASDSFEMGDDDAAAALARVAAEAGRSSGSRAVAPSVLERGRIATTVTGGPVTRHGVPYFEEWTIRVGATRLRVPAYEGWLKVRPEAEFFQQQSASGAVGDQLEIALLNRGFVGATRSRYANFFTLVWAPQQYAFSLMTRRSFAAFKQGLQEEAVAERRDLAKREEFPTFDDYINFKFGRDEELENFVDGYMIRAVDEEDLVVYFATSEFVFRGARSDIVEPMIATVTFALVEDKLVRIDTKRAYLGPEDAQSLVAYSLRFVSDMRALNALGGRTLR